LFKIPDADGDVRIFVSESAGEGVAALTITVGTSLICNRKELSGLHYNYNNIKEMSDNIEKGI
jgi:hypothetical protein